MSEKSTLGALLTAATKQREVIEVLRPFAKASSSMEALLEQALVNFNTIVNELLHQHLNKVSVKLDPKTGSWEKPHALLLVRYGGVQIRIPVKFLDGEVQTKVKNKMNIQNVVETATSELKNWTQPESWKLVSRPELAEAALSAINLGTAFVVPCTWRSIDLPGYNSVGEPDWDLIPRDHPISLVTGWTVLFASFSPASPGGVGRGTGENKGWLVLRPWTEEE